MTTYFTNILQTILTPSSGGFILNHRGSRAIAHKISNMGVQKLNAVLQNIGVNHYEKQIRATYINRNLLTRKRFRATWRDEIFLSKRLLLIQ